MRLDQPLVQDPEDPKGRAWFHFADGRACRYDGANGFLWRQQVSHDRYYNMDDLIAGPVAALS